MSIFVLNSIIDDISKGINWFSTSWIYAGSLIAIAVIFTCIFSFFQFRKINSMRKSYFNSENTSSKKLSPFKIFISSLASRFGLGNVVGVGFAIVIGGPGVILWMVLVGMFSMAVALVESTLAQIYHEKDPHNRKTFRGGTPYYIIKGLGNTWKWLAIAYAIASIFTKGLFVVGTACGTVANLAFFAFDKHYSGPNTFNNYPYSNLTSSWILWVVVVILVVFALVSIVGGVNKVLKISNIISPVIFIMFLTFVGLFLCFNYEYLGRAIKYIFIGFVNPNEVGRNLIGGVTAWTIATTIKQGAIRGIFAHEAGQGSTSHLSAIPKVDHPIKMGFGQALGVFIDIAVICVLSGLFFTTAIIKFADLNHVSIQKYLFPHNGSPVYVQAWFTMWASYNYLPHAWTLFLEHHHAGYVNNLFSIILLIILLGANIGMSITSIIMVEFSFIFLFRNTPEDKQKKYISIGRLIVPIGIAISPLLSYISKSIFSLADLAIACCFILNAIALVGLVKIVMKVYKDFEMQSNKHADELLKNEKGYVKTSELSFIDKVLPWFSKNRAFLLKRKKIISDTTIPFVFSKKHLQIEDKN